MRKTYFSGIIKLLILALGFALSAVSISQTSIPGQIISMKAHEGEKLVCTDCHTKGDTTNAIATVVPNCISCHALPGENYYYGTRDEKGHILQIEYPESGKTKLASIHNSHGGEIRCTVCHTSHKDPEPLYCNNCHQFDLKVK